MAEKNLKSRLVIVGGAILISGLSFALILWTAAWLPAVLFHFWLHMTPAARTLARAVPAPLFIILMMFAAWVPIAAIRPARRAHSGRQAPLSR
ncbi:MAG TPA: hypothetical protein VHX37_17060 [Acidobacteriaceae bacterium]|jgi:hypothetical protein|nr:hypothetical protein [Acidobacteriaceae bacterium]